MTSKERIAAALNHRQPDQVPIDFGGSSTTGIHVTAVAALRDYYGLEKRPVKVHEPYQMLGLLEEDLLQVMKIDVQGAFAPKTMFGFPATSWKPFTAWGLNLLVPRDFNTSVDPNGDILIYPEGDMSVPPSGRMPTGSYFFDAIIRQPPIDEETLDPADNLEEFKSISDEDLANIQQQVGQAAATGRAVLASVPGTALGDIALVPGPFLKYPKGIRDVTEWYVSTRSRRDYIHRIFESQCQIALANLERIHGVVGGLPDAVFVCGTDFGTQTSSFCSVATFRELYFPYYKVMNDWIHAHTSWKTFKHSCGAVDKFISSLIECGFDILNPVQCSATGMDPEHLKSTYGRDIVFWGGGVDTQRTLPFGTPAEIREQVLSRCEVFSKGGGFVFNSIHNVQAQTPVENIAAMIEAVHEFNGR